MAFYQVEELLENLEQCKKVKTEDLCENNSFIFIQITCWNNIPLEILICLSLL